MGRGVPGGCKARVELRQWSSVPAPLQGTEAMSALGKSVLEGDFDNDGQVVVQTPLERVIERSVVVTRTVTEVSRSEGEGRSDHNKPAAKPAPVKAAPRHNTQPPLPGSVRESGSDHKKMAGNATASGNGMPQPPLPYPLAPRPKPSDLILDHA